MPAYEQGTQLTLHSIAKATAAANDIISSRAQMTMDKQMIIPISTSPAGISFQGVAFTYPGRSIPVLRDMTFEIKPGQFAAFVGASGAGKSTIISLIEA